MSESSKTAIEIVYELPQDLSAVYNKITAIEHRMAFLEQKINMILAAVSSYASDKTAASHSSDDASTESKTNADDSEVMEILHAQSPPFSFKNQPEKNIENTVKMPLSAPSEGIRIISKEVDPMPQNAISSEPAQEKQTSTLIRGRLKEREGSSIAAVDVKIFDAKSIMVKKTKTAATGEWIAMLPPGEYTAEFTKPGQKPLFKPISIVSGKKELEILI